METFDELKRFLGEIDITDIKFKEHFYDRVKERPISEDMIKKNIKNTKDLINVEEQPSRKRGEKKYKLWMKLSNKYSLVVIVAKAKKSLYIITAWNTDKKWQKAIQR